MKNILACMIFTIAVILTLPQPLVVFAQKKQEGKAPAIETDQLSAEQAEVLLKEFKEREEIVARLKFQEGEIKLKDGLATLKVPSSFRYLDSDQTDTVLVQLWRNPPRQEKTLGMLIPADISLASVESWGVVITFQEDGYVEDGEAASIDYQELLKAMKEGMREANEERTKQGYDTVELIGWAAPPRYDKDSNKLFWAKELSFGGDPEHTLNYDIRALGRRGVLSLNAVASIGQLQMVEKDMRQVLSFVEFNEGHRYGDYVAGADKVAAYGIGALIAGKVAAKAGLFKLLLVFLAKGWKLLIIAIPLIGFLVKKLLSGRRKEEPAATSAAE
jgi:uncharacterized membrane-anchored protein